MSDIDEKLVSVLTEYFGDVEYVGYSCVEKIREVLAEAGYIPMSKLNQPRNLMTGQEWFKKFEAEVASLEYSDEYSQAYVEAAKRAAGLDT